MVILRSFLQRLRPRGGAITVIVTVTVSILQLLFSSQLRLQIHLQLQLQFSFKKTVGAAATSPHGRGVNLFWVQASWVFQPPLIFWHLAVECCVCGGEHPLFRGGPNRLEAGLALFLIIVTQLILIIININYKLN